MHKLNNLSISKKNSIEKQNYSIHVSFIHFLIIFHDPNNFLSIIPKKSLLACFSALRPFPLSDHSAPLAGHHSTYTRLTKQPRKYLNVEQRRKLQLQIVSCLREGDLAPNIGLIYINCAKSLSVM